MAISNSTFQYLQQLIRSWSGIHLPEKDKYLVEARLLPLTRQHKVPSVEDLIERVREGSANGLGPVILDALLPKESYFFRNLYPFELLRSKIFPTLQSSRFRKCKLNIWCAGGQEAYSIAMVLHRYFSELLRWKVDILATDISKEAWPRRRKADSTKWKFTAACNRSSSENTFASKGPIICSMTLRANWSWSRS